MTLSAIMLPEFDREMARTRKVLEALPAGEMSWQAHESLHNLTWNANHIVEIVGWAPLIIERDEFDMAPVGGPSYTTPSEADPAVLLKQFDQNVTAARAALAATSDATMAEDWSLKSGGQTYFTISKGECLRTWVLNHIVHHRGILSVYLRMFGARAEGVYDG